MLLFYSVLAFALRNANGQTFIPRIVQTCGRPILHYSVADTWVPDHQTDCMQSEEQILAYCKETYPEFDISALELSTRFEYITNWCSLGEVECTVQNSFTALPFICKVADLNDEADDDFFLQEQDQFNIVQMLQAHSEAIIREEITPDMPVESLLSRIIEENSIYNGYFVENPGYALEREFSAKNAASLANLKVLLAQEFRLAHNFTNQLAEITSDLWLLRPRLAQQLENRILKDFRLELWRVNLEAMENHKRLTETHLMRMGKVHQDRENKALQQFRQKLKSSSPREMGSAAERMIKTLQFLRLHMINRFENLRGHDLNAARVQLPAFQTELTRLAKLMHTELGKLSQMPEEIRALVGPVIKETMQQYVEVEANSNQISALTKDSIIPQRSSLALPSLRQLIGQRIESRVELFRHHPDPVVGSRVSQAYQVEEHNLALADNFSVPLFEQREADEKRERLPRSIRLVANKIVPMSSTTPAGIKRDASVSGGIMMSVVAGCCLLLILAAIAFRWNNRRQASSSARTKYTGLLTSHVNVDEEDRLDKYDLELAGELEFDDPLGGLSLNGNRYSEHYNIWGSRRCIFNNPTEIYSDCRTKDHKLFKI